MFFSFIPAFLPGKDTLLDKKLSTGQSSDISVHTPRDSPGNHILRVDWAHSEQRKDYLRLLP